MPALCCAVCLYLEICENISIFISAMTNEVYSYLIFTDQMVWGELCCVLYHFLFNTSSRVSDAVSLKLQYVFPVMQKLPLDLSIKCHLKLLLVFTLFAATATYFCEDVHQRCFLSASGSVNNAKAEGFIFTRSTSTNWLTDSNLPKSRK